MQLSIRPAPALQKLFTQTVQKVLSKTAEFVFTLCPDKSPFHKASGLHNSIGLGMLKAHVHQALYCF